MNVVRRIWSETLIALFASLTLASAVAAQEDNKVDYGKLLYADSVWRESLLRVSSVEVSPDGRFLYASAWLPATIHVFSRNPLSGKLRHVQEITDHDALAGATGLRLSPSGRYVVASAFRSKTAVLFRRDPMDGTLTPSDVARNEVNGVRGLQWPVDAAFSPDSRFVYIVDACGSGSSDNARPGSVTAFQISEEGQLHFIEANTADGQCFANVRGIAVHPNGRTIVVTASTAGTLVVLDRDPKNGTTKVRQIIRNEANEVHGLDGAMGVALSPDGQFVYTSAGRFRGDDAIGVYKFDDSGTLSPVQEIVNDQGELTDFLGGNELTVSPDGRNVYATATRSGSLACFERDRQSGTLKLLELISDEESPVAGAAGIGVSPDGQFLYLAAENNQTVTIFRRQTSRE